MTLFFYRKLTRNAFVGLSSIAIFTFLLPSTSIANNRSMLEVMVERLVNKQMPKVLLTANDVQWNAGTMNIVITKTGSANLKEAAKKLFVKLPIEVQLQGRMKQAVGPLEIDMNCKVHFQSIADIQLMPQFGAKGKLVSQSKVSIPVPPVDADCEGISLPAAATLQLLIDQNTPNFEKEINKMVEKHLN